MNFDLIRNRDVFFGDFRRRTDQLKHYKCFGSFNRFKGVPLPKHRKPSLIKLIFNKKF